MRRRYGRCSYEERRSPKVSWFIIFFLMIAIFFFNYFGKKLGSSRYPKVPPGVVLLTPEGEPFEFSPVEGRFTVLLFVTTGCEPCRREMEEVARLDWKWVDRVVVYLDKKAPSISLGGVKVYGTHPKEITRVVELMGVDRVPTTFIIDDRGLVRRKIEGYIDLEDLEAYLKAIRRYRI